MVKIKDILNIVSFIFTLFLIVYGFAKGYDLVELGIYNLYFITEIIVQLINIFYREDN